MNESVERFLREARYDLALQALEMERRNISPSSAQGAGAADPQREAGLLCDEGEIHLSIGDAEAARHAADRAVALAKPANLLAVLARAYIIRARVELAQEDYVQARAHAGDALQHVPEDAPAELKGWAYLVAAQVALSVGNASSAEDGLDLVEQLLPGAPVLAVPFTLARAELLLSSRQWSEASRLLQQTLEEADRTGRREAQWVAVWLLAQVSLNQGALKEARAWRERAAARIREIAGALPAEMAARYLAHPARIDALEGSGVETGLVGLLESNDAALLARIVQIIGAMNGETEPSRLLALIVDAMLEVCNGRRGMILLSRADGPTIEVARHRDGRALTEDELRYSRSIVQEVARAGKPVVLTNARGDQRFSGSRSVMEMELRSILCLPLRLRRRQIGVVYLDNNLLTHAFHEREMNAARVLADQAAIAVENAMLLSRSIHDPATGLTNHAHFEALVQSEANRAKRTGRPFSIVIADLDQFQRVNEKYGHAVGSQLLTQAARLLAECVRSYDAVASAAMMGRYGGDEFEILLPDTGREGLASAAERMLQAFRARIFTIGPHKISLTVTVGGAVCPEDASDSKELVARTEDALKRAKSEGRDRFVMASDKKATGEAWVPARPRHAYTEIVGRSRALQELLCLLDRVVEVDYAAVIEGETGTGKELIAHAIHRYSPRREAPFIAVNCAALSETLLESELFGHVKGAFTGAQADRAGLFEQAHKGTLFLDEVEEMSDAMQKKFLRVLEERKIRRVGGTEAIPVDARVVAATNKELKALVAKGRFREDLFYRLSTFVLRVPPLRERAEDIPLLIDHMLDSAVRETGVPKKVLSAGARALLVKYPWPGNVRELQNEIRRAVMTSGEVILESDLPPHLRDYATSGLLLSSGSYRERLESFEKRIVLEALESQGWNLSATARVLEIDRNTLKSKMAAFGIDRPDTKRRVAGSEERE